jgi:hypothetical protein
MQTVLAAALAALFVINAGGAAAPALSADRNDEAEAEIKALELHLARLLVERRIDEYETHLAADYTRINASGVVETREQVLKTFRASSAGDVSGSMEPAELDVRIYGDTAILTGRLTVTSRAGTVRVSRFRKVFIRRDGRWFLVSLQGVTLPDRSGAAR